jgi:hypothetical protein
MIRFKTHHFLLLIGLISPIYSSAANYCVAVGGGFGSGGTSFVGKGFAVPAAGACKPWAGYLKTGATVIATTTGAGCLSSDGKVLQITLLSTDPSFFGSNSFAVDQIRLCPAGVGNCPIGGGQDVGYFTGAAKPQTCTTQLLGLPATHD